MPAKLSLGWGEPVPFKSTGASVSEVSGWQQNYHDGDNISPENVVLRIFRGIILYKMRKQILFATSPFSSF